ncbi:MAG: hypothetical protein GY861_23115 [bacterium]|nr:hypothetical protein [bacterium]
MRQAGIDTNVRPYSITDSIMAVPDGNGGMTYVNSTQWSTQVTNKKALDSVTKKALSMKD